MALNKQIHIYSVDTSFFYNEDETIIHEHMNRLFLLKNKIVKYQTKRKKILSETRNNEYNTYITNINRKLKQLKDEMYLTFSKCSSMRTLKTDMLGIKNIVSVFDSILTRTLNIPINSLCTDLFIVQTYFFDVVEDIILDGFIFNGEKYVCLTASAGQIRTKKTVFIKESTLIANQKSFMCGLTVDIINSYGGVNINKYLAYLALCNSATDEWIGFDIDKCIVVDDFETFVNGEVDFIDDKTYKIARQIMPVPISHTDGCGMILPRVNKKNFMTRLPWVKGLLSPFAFDEFIKEFNCSSKIIDIYGKEWDIFDDNIEIIFTKSQFKMYKYYKSWQEYKDYFKLYNCQAGICNLEEDEFTNAKINYQMLQSLVEMTDDEIRTVAEKTNADIKRIGSDRRTMLKVLGVTKANTAKNYYQQALEKYPQLLCDTYSKEILKQTKKSMVKQARAGKLQIDGKYTFIIPDLFAFCEYLFKGNSNPTGLLGNNEVYCSLYRDVEKVACLRSPHLYREWAVRNIIIDETKNKWFITRGLYTSCHDLISKILQFDVDGDKSLVCAEKVLVDSATIHMNDIVPLYYNMRKANAEIITSQTIYNGLKSAYTGGNIGMYSNDISKIWNSKNINLDVIKLLCMENNFTIDYAKTLYKPQRPNHIKKIICSYTRAKTPHFFIYAKDKTIDQVESINNSLVNRLEKIVKNPRIKFETDDIGEFNYRMLMQNINADVNHNIINKYRELDLKKRFMDLEPDEDDTGDNIYIYKDIKNKLLDIDSNVDYIVDVLIKYLYKEKNSSYKTTLWSAFGDVIVENLKNNIKIGNVYCEKCGDLITNTINNKKYCNDCAKEQKKILDRQRMQNKRNSRKR